MDLNVSYLLSLASLAEAQRHRFLVYLQGTSDWQNKLFSAFVEQKRYQKVFKLGGNSLGTAELYTYKQGNNLLGTECDSVFYDCDDGFDANSFTAVSGTIKAGGLLFVNFKSGDIPSTRWLNMALQSSITISENLHPPALPQVNSLSVSEKNYSEQKLAIEQVHKVVKGHRKRPLVLTADRGRGKSSALGMAAAQLMSERKMTILLTAPARKSVEPVFQHARANLAKLEKDANNSISTGQSTLRFISPDELLRGKPDCDLLLVDEASAIPLPMLEKIVSEYHRTVFSATIHGYEGCGRGFTVKFFNWLNKYRPGWHHFHIKQAIRWSDNDPLEQWIFDTFLLNSEILSDLIVDDINLLQFSTVSKTELMDSPALFRQCFALLVNAHYQTSPNDLLQILDDESIYLFTLSQAGRVIACVIGKLEGNIQSSLADDIVLGTRRPKGHLAPVLLASQLGLKAVLADQCLRVMRIAVAPQYQGRGLGSLMLTKLSDSNELNVEYLATSYGLTKELHSFWKKNSFAAVRLGSTCDNASGTHSLLMVRSLGSTTWYKEAVGYFFPSVVAQLPETFVHLDESLAIQLLSNGNSVFSSPKPSEAQSALVSLYAQGGSSYESVIHVLTLCLVDKLSEESFQCPPILMSKILQRKSWQSCATLYGYAGRKQTEKAVRKFSMLLI